MQPVYYARNTADNTVLPVRQPVSRLSIFKSGIFITAQNTVLI
jgi:hypothetical protein